VSRKRIAPKLFMLALPLALLAGAAGAQQGYPNKPLRIVVPYGPGSAPDVVARTVGELLSPRLGQAVVIENRLGAGGKVGTEFVARAAGDGYTLLLGSKDTHGVMEHLFPGWDVKPMRDFAPVSLLVRIQNLIVANKELKAANLRELIALAKTQEINYGTPGVGTNLHLLAEMFKQMHGLKLNHIPYKTVAEIFPAVMRGEAQLAVLGVPPSAPFVRDGRLRALAATGEARTRFLPDVPTFAESGVAGFESGGWFALFAPSSTPADIVRRLNSEVVEMGRQPGFRERTEKIQAEAATSSSAELATLVAGETARWGEVVRKSGVKLE
jgi:tripartite-type tricarboxylate transporter receptor subunit TctC